MKVRILQIAIVLLALNGLGFYLSDHLCITPFYIFAPIIVLFGVHKVSFKITKAQFGLLGFLLFLIPSMLVNNESIAHTTVLHLLFYLMMGYIMLARTEMNIEQFIRVNKIVLALYFWSVIIAVFLSTIAPSSFLGNNIFHFIYKNGHYRYSGFASEPSYLALILTTCMLSMIYFRSFISRKILIRYLLLYIASIIISGTTFGLLGLFLVLIFLCQKCMLPYLKKKQGVAVFILAVLLMICFFTFPLIQNNHYFVRLSAVFSAIMSSTSLNDMLIQLNMVDSSAYFRMGPTIKYLQQLDIASLKTWFGNGITTSDIFFTKMYHFPDGYSLNLGYIPAFFYGFGLLGGGYFTYFIFSTIKKLPWIFIVFVVLALTNCNISTQMFWFIIVEMFYVIRLARFNNKLSFTEHGKE